jgi:hypothetical protein
MLRFLTGHLEEISGKVHSERFKPEAGRPALKRNVLVIFRRKRDTKMFQFLSLDFLGQGNFFML